MTLKDFKLTVPAIRYHNEMQFITCDQDYEFHMITMRGMGHSGIEAINGDWVITSRAYGMDWYER